MEFGADYKWEEWQPLMVAQLLNCCDMIWYDWTCGDAVCLDSAVGVVSVAAAAEREQPDGFAAAVQCCRTKTTSLVDDVVESASESCFSGSIKAGNFGFKMGVQLYKLSLAKKLMKRLDLDDVGYSMVRSRAF